MSNLARISISVEEKLLEKFDDYVEKSGFPTRSEAMKNIMREAIIRDEWMKGEFVAGNISLVYDHHKPGIVEKLLHSQHDFCDEIQCSQHIHLDHSNCMEIIVLRGKGERIREILKRLHQIKGLKHIVLTMGTLEKQNF
ncbi:MAG: nickel-responsive transcriptional regulator NikR [Planctomycetia bacterium]|nr:nickel-responsive transcriptional regulator NikR [Planctomycetia bacterium]